MKIGRKVGMPKREVVVGEEIDYLVWHSGTLALWPPHHATRSRHLK